ncbi:TIGR02677 family protein [Amycolatopsis balhimycina DSM 5908]|uniref:TIGR02677 family protein n=1 Tax=Amycolatopsis balhimycina DSM 5908 TaxID=1081091 RepID=A0A428WR27_AMYBA|nr:TIGR02677 family protein [Amycolatopsis balhimycina]RSM45499.1 TIGR02677 family protein [Amycolatopsis balhimycina DSM 5908]
MQDFQPFAHLTAPNTALYRSVMGAFVQAKRRFTVHLRPEDVRETLDDVELTSVADALAKLVSWGNLRADPDTSRVTTVEDFHRARFLYQLTERGEAAEQALTAYDEALGRRGALQAVALSDIATQLQALLELSRQAAPDPAKVHLLLRGLVDRFTDLAGNAQAFMGSLQRTIDLHDADIDAFRAYKDRLIDYLERFIRDLVGTGGKIASLIEEIEGPGVGALLDIAAWREAEDAAPGHSDGTDDPRRPEFERVRPLWQERWHGVRAWFVSAPQHPSQAKLLRSQARAAIPQLLQVVAALNERRSGRSDRSADFRSLAKWFAEAPDDAALHRLWRSAFGLSASRHLTIDSDTLQARDENPVPAGTPWAQAPSLEISPRLRKTGSYERRGKPNRVVDRSEQRRYLAELAAREAAETAAARAALVTGRPTRLTDLGELDPAAFRLFLALLGDALAARTPGKRAVGTTTVSNSDGSMAIRLTALENAELAEIKTPHGIFRGPDHLVDIVDLTADDVEEASA